MTWIWRGLGVVYIIMGVALFLIVCVEPGLQLAAAFSAGVTIAVGFLMVRHG